MWREDKVLQRWRNESVSVRSPRLMNVQAMVLELVLVQEPLLFFFCVCGDAI